MAESPIFYRCQQERIGFGMLFMRKFNEQLEGRFWKSSDISVAQNIVLPQGESKYVPISLPSNLRPFRNLPVDMFSYSNFSTRSRYAQLGLSVSADAGHIITETIEQRVYREGEEGLRAFVDVTNYSQRPISLAKGAGLFRLYAYPYSERTDRVILGEGKKLLDMIKTGEIAIDGQRGEDWEIALDKEYEGDESAWGMVLRIDPKKECGYLNLLQILQ